MALHLFKHEEIDYEEGSVITEQDMERIHPDLKDLVWFADGPHQNYDFQPYIISADIKGFTFELGITKLEQSLIFTGLPLEGPEKPLPVGKVKDAYYVNLTPEDRRIFWLALENPYGLQTRHEYIYMLLHGLERSLLAGDCMPAARCIFEMRKFIGDRPFRNITANGLMMTALLRNNSQIAEEFLSTMHPYYYYDFSGDLYVMMMYGLDVPLTPERLMILYKNFGYKQFQSVHIRNLRQFGDIYLLELQKAFDEKYGSQEILLKDFISREEYLNLPRVSVPVYTSAAISDHDLEIPQMMAASAFRDFTKLIEETDTRAQKTRFTMYSKYKLSDEVLEMMENRGHHHRR